MKSALIVVDMLNSYEHDDAEQLTPERRKDRDHEVELIYVNDNYGDWNSSQEELAKRALDGARSEASLEMMERTWAPRSPRAPT